MIGGSLVIDGCRFENNRAESSAGAISIENAGTVTVRSSVFDSNQAGFDDNAGFGGAIGFDGDELRLESCTFTANTASGGIVCAGGAIRSFGRVFVAENCLFSENLATAITSPASGIATGGAIDVNAAERALFSGCEFRRNRVCGGGSSGGAVKLREVVRAAFADCVFVNNSVEATNFASGGALTVIESEAEFVRCLIEANTVPADLSVGFGGGIALDSNEGTEAVVTIVNSRLVGNRAETGGAIAASGSGLFGTARLRVAGSVVSGNESASGVAVGNRGETVILSSTIAGNRALPPGGARAALEAIDGPLTLANSVLWANGDDADQASELSVSEPPTITSVCVEGWDASLGGVGNFSADPLFRDPDGDDDVLGTGDDDYALLRFSPCIDAGDNGEIPPDRLDADGDGDTAERLPVDIDGRPRRADDVDVADTGAGDAPVVDIGASEFQRRSCPADLDGNGILDLSDINAFVVGFPAQDPGTDLNGDGVWDLSDINLFLTVFTGGCAG